MANGWPIAHHVFPGNTSEKTTLVDVLTDLEKRFGLGRVMVVGDRGMVSPKNLEFLAGSRFRYLLGLTGRRNKEAAAVLDALDEQKWERVDKGNLVQEIKLADPGVESAQDSIHKANESTHEAESVRYFVIDSQEHKVYEQAMRGRSMKRAKEASKCASGKIEKHVRVNGNPGDPPALSRPAARKSPPHSQTPLRRFPTESRKARASRLP